MTKLIEIKNLSVGFQSQNKSTDVVHSISFNIPKGKTIALVGESGSGKTVTAALKLKGKKVIVATVALGNKCLNIILELETPKALAALT